MMELNDVSPNPGHLGQLAGEELLKNLPFKSKSILSPQIIIVFIQPVFSGRGKNINI